MKLYTSRIWRGSKNLLFTAPLEVTFPDWSTWTSGPSQETSKYDLMVMLYAEGVKNRLLAGARREEALERNAESAAERSWWVCCMTANGGVSALTCVAVRPMDTSATFAPCRAGGYCHLKKHTTR
jgi:hypothetical protein